MPASTLVRHHLPSGTRSGHARPLKAAGQDNLHVQLVSSPIAQGASGSGRPSAGQGRCCHGQPAPGQCHPVLRAAVPEVGIRSGLSFYRYYLPSVAQFFVPSGPYSGATSITRITRHCSTRRSRSSTRPARSAVHGNSRSTIRKAVTSFRSSRRSLTASPPTCMA